MSDERITVYGPSFSVPGSVVETGISTVRINYHPPGEARLRSDWFHVLGNWPRSGQRMGDHDDQPVRYSVSGATTRDEAA